MGTRSAVIFALAGVIAATGPAIAAPTQSGVATARPAAPKSGYYKVASAFSTGGKGHFRIAKRHVTGLTAVADANEVQYCGSDSYQVLGRSTIHYITGGGHKAWIVGKRYTASASYELTPIAVTVKHDKTRTQGTLRMRFDVNAGQLDVPDCTMAFSLHRAHK